MGVDSSMCCAKVVSNLRETLAAHRVEMKAVMKTTDSVVFCTIAK
jgi:hypothetical protein